MSEEQIDITKISLEKLHSLLWITLTNLEVVQRNFELLKKELAERMKKNEKE